MGSHTGLVDAKSELQGLGLWGQEQTCIVSMGETVLACLPYFCITAVRQSLNRSCATSRLVQAG